MATVYYEPRSQQLELRVGAHVRLSDYSRHLDWSDHHGQVATVVEIQTGGIPHALQYRVHIRWDDGITSSAPESNIIVLATLRAATPMKPEANLSSFKDYVLSQAYPIVLMSPS